MAAIASGLNFSTLSQEGIALNICNTFVLSQPEYPALPFELGTPTLGLDGSEWVYAKPAAAYGVGTVGYFDTSWNFTALTATNAANANGQQLGVMSQVASVTSSPSSSQYDGVWVQTSGLCPAIQVAASTSANAQLYASSTAGQLTSTGTPGTTESALGIILTTAQGSGGAGTSPGVLNAPVVGATLL